MKRSTIPLGKNFGSKALSSLRMILFSASHTRMLLSMAMLVMMVLAPNGVKAEIVTDAVYDFKASINAGQTEVVGSQTNDVTYTGCYYFSKLGNVSDPDRFAGANNTTWHLGLSSYQYGLYNYANGNRLFLVSRLSKGNIVVINTVNQSGNSTNASLVSNNATQSGNTFTMKEKGVLAVNIGNYNSIVSITIQHDDAAVWGYDPAIETYDMYWNDEDITSNNLKPAGFNLDYDDYEAQYLTNLLSGTALNDRIAISQVEYNGHYTPWDIDHGFKSLYNWHNISITNLVEGDRVVITWIGDAKFSSKAQQDAYNGCAAFKDNGNDGDFTEGEDTEISLGMSLEAKTTNWDGNANANIYTSYPYVITEDGHLDIALSANSKIVKVVIYGDHQAEMVDKDNDYGTSTSYFNTTGQLEAKHHIVPGGLHVYVGNDDDTQHAEVVRSDKGPVSFVYDEEHYKMARYGDVDVMGNLPRTGTFYKFVPEVTGKMWVKFKAVSVKYRYYNNASIPGNGVDSNGTPNEYTANVNCPYYLMVAPGDNNAAFSRVEDAHYYGNGADGYFGSPNGSPGNGQSDGITVERGKTYYLYGWWQDGTNLGSLTNSACGVAELLEVTFSPNQSVEPLAKWVETKTTSDGELATVKGYNTVRVKKKSSNIASCEPYIEGGKLKIRNITFVDENKGGGTILIKIGDPNIDADPVFAYTIAYDAGYNPSEVGQDVNGTTITRSEGHTWNFSDQPLKGLKWNNKNAEADEAVFGPYFNNFATADKDANGVPTNGVNSNSFLYEEMNKTGADGTKLSDWTFNYRVKKNGQFLDPRFLNNWDMEGDNADMMWDTEGIIINAGSSQSCIFDEFMLTNNRIIDHTNKTQADPDRYVGFLEGGEFIIPCLKKDDRVIVYMGSGSGSGAQAMEFHITNARDAMYNLIDPDDSYHAGGSQWNVPNGHNDPYYRGCYHFFAAADGDMKFTMSGGSMCKLYSIKIYRGARECTNSVQEESGGYTLLAVKDQEGNVTSTETKSWTLHFRGKGEQVADGTGANGQANEVIANSGNIKNKELGILRGGQSNSRIGITYTNQGEIGMLRVRVKCMEYNQKYVTDFADRNFTLALHETMAYPYTWDFTDVNGFSSGDIEGEYGEYNEITDLTTINAQNDDDKTWYEPLGRELSIWDENGAMVLRTPEEYVNQNMIFENSKGINGNQLWANGNVIPETQGLWWYMDSNDPTYNSSMQITEEGLRLANTKRTVNGSNTMGWWNYKMVVPAVPSGAAVYLRMKRDNSVKDADYSQKPNEDPVYFLNTAYHFGVSNTTDNPKIVLTPAGEGYVLSNQADVFNATGSKNSKYSFFNVKDENGNVTDEWIVAVKNTTGSVDNLTFTLNGWILEKMSISEDTKSVNIKGYASESRDHDIDASLTAFLTGKAMKSYLVSNPNYKKYTLTLTDMGSAPTYVIQANTGYVIFNSTDENKLDVFGTDSGFHLFVPDMHDDEKSEGKFANVETNNVFMVPVLEERTGTNKLMSFSSDGKKTNYVLSYKWYDLTPDGSTTGQQHTGDEMFYRVSREGINLRANSAYLVLDTESLGLTTSQGSIQGSTQSAKFTFVFSDWSDAPVLTAIESANVVETFDATDGVWYNLNGQKFNSKPTTKGLYIVNGKKVLVK